MADLGVEGIVFEGKLAGVLLVVLPYQVYRIVVAVKPIV